MQQPIFTNFDVNSFLGFIVTVLLGLPVGIILKGLMFDVNPPAEITNKTEKESLQKLIAVEPAMWAIASLGFLERTIFFVLLEAHQPIAIAGWLTFKAVTKWAGWTEILKFPANERDLGISDPVEFLRWKHEWATQVSTRALVGILLNLVIATIGVLVAHMLRETSTLETLLECFNRS